MPPEVAQYAHWTVQGFIILWIAAYSWKVLGQLKKVTFDKKEMWYYLSPLLSEGSANLAKRENADWQAVLALVSERESSKLAFARPVPNNLLLLGLLGTVIGLALTVWGLIPALSSDQVPYEQVKADLSIALSHMSSAFVCTLAGLSGALVVSRATQSKFRELAQLLPEWNRDIVEEIAKRSPFLTAAVVDELKKSVLLLEKSLSLRVLSLNNSIDNLNKAVTEMAPSLDSAAAKFKATIDEAKAAISESVGVLSATSGQMKETSLEMKTTLTLVAGQVHQSVEALKQSSDKLNRHHTNLINAHKEVVQALSDWEKKVGDLIEGHKKRVEELQEVFHDNSVDIVNRLVDVSDQLNATVASFKEAQKAFADEGLKIQSAWEHHFGKVQEFIQSVSDSLKALFSEDVERLFKDHRFALDEVEKALKLIQRTIEEVEKHLQNMQAVLSSHSNGQLEKLIQSLDALRESVMDKQAALAGSLAPPKGKAVEALVEGQVPRARPSDAHLRSFEPLQGDTSSE